MAKTQERTYRDLGFGLGLRPDHFSHIIERRPDVSWFEIISENYMDTDGKPRRMLDALRERYPVVMHGVSLSIGTVDPLHSEYLAKLKALADHIDAPWVSDHLCWTGVAHKNTHDLLPVPYTEEALKHIVSRIRAVQDYLERPLILENPSTYLEFSSSSMPEWEFIARMAEEADCGLLLDVNNIYVSCFNHKWDPKTYINSLPHRRVAQIHLAGHSNKGTHIIDTHDAPVTDEVWALYRYALGKTGPVSTMVEWDDKIPSFEVVMDELGKAKKWAGYTSAQPPLPSFGNGGHRELTTGAPLPLAKQMTDMQNAILSGDSSKMNLKKNIVPKAELPPEKQIGIYVDGYRFRLFDIVFEDYPALRHYLGKKAFAALLDAYIEQTPSEYFSVSRYVDKFPAFVAQHGKDTFAHELAVLETAISRLFDATETRAMQTADVSGLTPEAFMDAVLHPRAALRLFAFQNAVNDYYTQALFDEENAKPRHEVPCFVAVFRHEDKMQRLALEEREYTVLSKLFAGAPVGDAISDLEGEEEARVGQWFSRWLGHGLLSSIGK